MLWNASTFCYLNTLFFRTMLCVNFSNSKIITSLYYDDENSKFHNYNFSVSLNRIFSTFYYVLYFSTQAEPNLTPKLLQFQNSGSRPKIIITECNLVSFINLLLKKKNENAGLITTYISDFRYLLNTIKNCLVEFDFLHLLVASILKFRF